MMHSPKWAALVLAALMAILIPVGAAAQTTNGGASTTRAAVTQDVTRTVNTFTNVPVAGTTAGGGTFRGVVDIVNFRVIDGQLTAIGELSGRVFDAEGDFVRTITDQRVRLPIAIGARSTCDILHLKLGPLDLDLLGLKIHLDRIVLDITAEAGPGNLLGNLLCAIAHLLDRGLDLDAVLRDLLRAILGVFQL